MQSTKLWSNSAIAGINCGVVGAAYCTDGKTIFGFVAAALSLVFLGLMYLVSKQKLNFGSLGEEKSFALLAMLLGKC